MKDENSLIKFVKIKKQRMNVHACLQNNTSTIYTGNRKFAKIRHLNIMKSK